MDVVEFAPQRIHEYPYLDPFEVKSYKIHIVPLGFKNYLRLVKVLNIPEFPHARFLVNDNRMMSSVKKGPKCNSARFRASQAVSFRIYGRPFLTLGEMEHWKRPDFLSHLSFL